MKAKNAEREINQFFQKHQKFFRKDAPAIIAKTSVEYYKESFRNKGFDGKPWPPLSKRYKPRRGSMMVRSSKLMNSIRDTLTTPDKVVISAGNSKVPYAKIHNEGGEIRRAARSEIFRRNRISRGARKGRFKKGSTAGKGFSFKAATVRIPQRQFMGYAHQLNKRVIDRFKAAYKFK